MYVIILWYIFSVIVHQKIHNVFPRNLFGILHTFNHISFSFFSFFPFFSLLCRSSSTLGGLTTWSSSPSLYWIKWTRISTPSRCVWESGIHGISLSWRILWRTTSCSPSAPHTSKYVTTCHYYWMEIEYWMTVHNNNYLSCSHWCCNSFNIKPAIAMHIRTEEQLLVKLLIKNNQQ